MARTATKPRAKRPFTNKGTKANKNTATKTPGGNVRARPAARA